MSKTIVNQRYRKKQFFFQLSSRFRKQNKLFNFQYLFYAKKEKRELMLKVFEYITN
jgi:hypothetical protein